MNNEILPGLTPADAQLLAQLAMRGLQTINADAQRAGAALEAAIQAATQPPEPLKAAAPQGEET